MTANVVIVGSGQAGVSVAFKLRAFGYVGRIMIIGEETELPYLRPPLSKKYLMTNAEAASIHIKPKELYDKDGIELLVGCCVTAIDRNDKTVTLSGGQAFHYDYLVLATGARARRLSPEQGGDADNVYTFRSLFDARSLKEEMLHGRKLLVVGGGYIGLETAAVARSLGIEVTLVERDSRILGRVACADTATYFRSLHEAKGVRIIEGVELDGLEQVDKRATKACLSDGTEVDVDFVVAGIGVLPESTLAERSGLSVSNGIVVDSKGRTSDPSIYAAGDCACFPYEHRMIRLESVQNAVDMAEVIARSIVGEDAEYSPTPWFWSDQYTTKLQIAGLNVGYTHVAVRRLEPETVSVWYFDCDRLLAVDAINDAKAFMTAKGWISTGRSPNCEEITNPEIPLGKVSLIEQVID